MDSALVIGGTRFIGRHLVEHLLDHDYHVTLFTRGTHENPFAAHEHVDHVQGDRAVKTDLQAAAMTVDYDAVFDLVAYHPGDVETAVDVFADAEAYVYVSSGAAYGDEVIPKREGETGLKPCTPAQATDESPDSYGARKAAGDRAVFEAAEQGIRAMSVRPCVVYGPHDYTERTDYWLARVHDHDRVLVPGDGTNVWHRVYAPDVAEAMRLVAEGGTAGEAYNVGDRRLTTLREYVDLAADAMGTDVEVVTAGERELAAGGLAPTDFPLYRSYPHVMSTTKLTRLGWESTPLSSAVLATAADHRESDRDGSDVGPSRENAARVLGVLDTL
jgi:nucleoside-diphosphate-sugar epimerase